MNCEKYCNDINAKKCVECFNAYPAWANYCPHCGVEIDKESYETPSKKRVLCPDESCIGIIDENGQCTDCGRKY